MNTDHAAMLAMWAEDGVDLMPGEAPLLGKKAIDTWLKGIEKRGAGSRVSEEQLEFHDLQVSGEWASEWANEHQIVQPRENLRLKDMESSRWCCIVKKTSNGPLSKKCGMTLRTADPCEDNCCKKPR